MKSLSDKPKNILEITKKFIWALGLHAFAFVLFLIFIDIILGGVIFYNYVFLAEKGVPTGSENVLKFNAKTYQAVLGELQAREQGTEPSSGLSQNNIQK